jgi:hypothetical protein
MNSILANLQVPQIIPVKSVAITVLTCFVAETNQSSDLRGPSMCIDSFASLKIMENSDGLAS